MCTLDGKHIPVIEAVRIADTTVSEMPFPGNRRLVPICLQHLDNCPFPGVIDGIREGLDAGFMAVFSCENGATCWCTDGVRAETVVESHPIITDSVNIRGAIHLASIATDCRCRMIIGYDKEYIRFMCSRHGLSKSVSRPHALAWGYRHRPLEKDQNVHFFLDVWSEIVL